MIVLESTLCSKNFRKVGMIHSSVFLLVQVIIYLILLTGYWVDDRDGYLNVLRNNNVLILSFLSLVDIVLYSVLIYGLYSKKPALLIFWLTFAPSEFITVQCLLMFGSYVVTNTADLKTSIAVLTAVIVISGYMFHNMCIVMSARHGFMQEQESQNRNLAYQPLNASGIVANCPAPPYGQTNSQHFEYNAKTGQYVPTKCMYTESPPNYQEAKS